MLCRIQQPLDRGIDEMLARCKFENGADPVLIWTMFRRLHYLTPWSPSLQQIRDSAALRLDFVDFVASETVVSLDFVAELAKIPEFFAAVSAYRSLLPLGYCGFFCWPAVHHVFRQIAEEPLLDYLRVAAYCNDLPAADSRHVALDAASAKQRFPVLFHIDDFPLGPMRSSYASSLLSKMGSFAARHEFLAAGFAAVKKHDEDEYAAYLDRPL
jgi:hypothetical protein